MNILVSYNWLKEYLKTDLAPEDFASRVSLCGPSVERIHYQGADLDKIVVGKILGVEKHPNADKLRVAEVDIGPTSPRLRGASKKLKIVCGGSNLQTGMKVAVALSVAKVRWHGEGELVELKPTEIRGIKSEGMICAAEEIGLGEQFPKKDEKEILDLSDLSAKPGMPGSETLARRSGGVRLESAKVLLPGTPLAEALNLKDVIFDIEVTTNRPDMMSVLGIAREAGTILKSPFLPPKIASIKGSPTSHKASRDKGDGGVSLKVKNNEPDLCGRYQAVVIEGVKVAPSPWWLKQKLASAGTRSINNVVDITNFVLWEMGQPLHAFDYEKLSSGEIVIRKAKKGEKIKALDGQEYKLKEEMLVIADEKKPVAIAGVMGGETTGVTDGTRTIVLEAATFDPVSVRRTSRALNLRSESSNLFEKGLPAEATSTALARAAELVMQLAGGKIASKVFDLRVPRSLGEVGRNKDFKAQAVALSVEKANKIIGIELGAVAMADILKRLGFAVVVKGDEIKAKAPYWREGDVEIEEDLIEEIARVYGYHRLPSVLPPGAPPEKSAEKIFVWEESAKQLAVAAGYDEIISYGMISKNMMDAAGDPTSREASRGAEKAVKIANPLSVDLEYMRACLLPGLLSAVAQNENNFSSAKIFELSRVYLPAKKGELPKEELHFAGINYGKSPKGELFYGAKGFAETILEKFGISSSVIPAEAGIQVRESNDPNMHPARSCDIYLKNDWLGSFGEVHPVTAKNFGIGMEAGLFYFDFDALLRHAKSHKAYLPIPEYPGIKRDISFFVDKKTEYEKIKQAVISSHALVSGAEPFDVYEGKGVAEGKKSIALHIIFQSAHRTLEAKEADEAFDKIISVLKKDFGAEIRM